MAVYPSLGDMLHVDSRALPIRAENDEITFFAIFDPAEFFAAQKRLERNGHMHVRPSPRIPYIGRRTTRCARVSVTCLL